MNILLFIIYPLLALLLFFKAGFFKKDSFNEECLGLSQTKALLGFFSICIILHHVSQKPASFEYAALAPFRTSGYLFVSFFFFCSGYGLLKSFSSKPDYLKGFLNKRYLPLLITFFASDILFQFAQLHRSRTYVPPPQTIIKPAKPSKLPKSLTYCHASDGLVCKMAKQASIVKKAFAEKKYAHIITIGIAVTPINATPIILRSILPLIKLNNRIINMARLATKDS